MAGEMQHAPGSAMTGVAEPFVNRAVVQRCVIAAVLAIPGMIYAKDASSVSQVLASVVIGCMAMVVVAMPLAFLAASTRFGELCSRKSKARFHPALMAVITMSSAGVALGVLHGMALALPGFAHLLLAIGIWLIVAWLVKRRVSSTVPPATRSSIDAFALASGVLYGAIAGATSVPFPIIAGAIAIGSSMLARGSLANGLIDKPGRDESRGSTLLVISACAALVSLMMAPAVVPMVYPAIASAGCSLIATAFWKRLHQGDQVRAFVRYLVTISVFFEAAALFLCSA